MAAASPDRPIEYRTVQQVRQYERPRIWQVVAFGMASGAAGAGLLLAAMRSLGW